MDRTVAAMVVTGLLAASAAGELGIAEAQPSAE